MASDTEEEASNGKENVSETNNNFIQVHQVEEDNKPPADLTPCRKSTRTRKTPIHLSEDTPDASSAVGASFQKRVLKTPSMRTHERATSRLLNKPKKSLQLQNPYPDFQCDQCGSRYVINPMKRGNRISSAPYKAAPRHKIDQETQKILTLCNACGLKFGRQKKDRADKEILTEEDQKKFIIEGEIFAKELSAKLENENGAQLFCSHMKKVPCGCIQKYICGSETDSVDEILGRGRELVDILTKANDLKRLKCYDQTAIERKGFGKIGLGNGHRKSKEFEDFVLSERVYLRNRLKFCEKATQKILSYSNNFLHKRMKTDPEKGIRIERQKGKAALGMLLPIPVLPSEQCCVDNCVRMALTHGRLLEAWRERAISSQIEARRVLAEMLTPSGGNRANCYRFVSWVTGCSNTTIGKVNEQMKSTGGDREPPEHGLKKYWKDNPKKKIIPLSTATFVPSYQILQTAANSSGISSMLQNGSLDKLNEPQIKKPKRTNKNKGKIKDIIHSYDPTSRISQTISLSDVPENTQASNLQNVSVLALNGNFPNTGFISIPAGLTLQNAISLQATQQHLQQQQQQQQLQLQIQLLQQQLQNSQAVAALTQQTNEYMVTVSNPLGHNNNTHQGATPVVMQTQVGTPVVVQTVTSQPVVQNVVTQSLVANNTQSESILPGVIGHSPGGSINFLSSTGNVNVLQQSNESNTTRNNHSISLLTTPISNTGEISILTSPSNGINVIAQANPSENVRNTRSIAEMNYRPVHLITSQSPTMAHLSQPLTLHNPATISLATLPTMLLTQTTPNEGTHQQQRSERTQTVSHHQPLILQNHQTTTEHVVIHPALHTVQSTDTQQPSEKLIFQRPLPTHSSSDHVILHPLQTSQSQQPTQQVIFQKPSSHSTGEHVVIHPALQTVQSSHNQQTPEQIIIRRQLPIQSTGEHVIVHSSLNYSQSPTSQPQHEQIIIQRPSKIRQSSDHVVLHPTLQTVQSSPIVLHPSLQTVQSSQANSEKIVTISSSVLPSMASFSTDPFFSSGGTTTYAVINNGALSQIQPRQIIDEQSNQTSNINQVPFLQS